MNRFLSITQVLSQWTGYEQDLLGMVSAQCYNIRVLYCTRCASM